MCKLTFKVGYNTLIWHLVCYVIYVLKDLCPLKETCCLTRFWSKCCSALTIDFVGHPSMKSVIPWQLQNALLVVHVLPVWVMTTYQVLTCWTSCHESFCITSIEIIKLCIIITSHASEDGTMLIKTIWVRTSVRK